MSSLPIGTGGAEAILTQWDGHFAVDNSAANSTLTYTDQWRSNPDQCYGYILPDTKSNRHLQNYDNISNDDEHAADHGDDDANANDNTDCNDVNWKAVTDDGISGTNTVGTIAGRRRRRPLSERYSSPNQSSREESAWLSFFSRQTTHSSLIDDSITEIRVEDLQGENEPTSALLDYCKRKFLRPYLAILSVVALNPISTDTTICRSCLSYLQVLLVLILLIFGYILQYICSYRGDRGFSNYASYTTSAQTNSSIGSTHVTATHTIGELLFGHVIPNILHLCGYISAVVMGKIVGQEQLQNLIERTFLMSMQPRRLCRMLWIYVACGFIFVCLLFGYVIPSVLMQTEIVQIHWLNQALVQWKTTTKTTLLVTLFMQDLVEIVVLTGYCVECYLLRVHLTTLSHKLLMHSIESQNWMREMLEFRKLLDHLNQLIAIPVCFFIVMNLAYAFAGFVYLFNDFDFHYSALKVVIINIVNVLLWLLMGLAPFFMAASVTRVCQTAKDNGHHIRVRPFVYHNTSTDDLNSTLLFASTLDLSAKLFRMPIQSNYLCFAILVVSIVILTLGMCVNLIDLGSF